VAADFGRRFGVTPRWVGREMPTAWLANAGKAREWFGPPAVSVPEMIGWVADYLQGGGALLGKPTHFESRSGSF